jgi:hypothetical protein
MIREQRLDPWRHRSCAGPATRAVRTETKTSHRPGAGLAEG